MKINIKAVELAAEEIWNRDRQHYIDDSLEGISDIPLWKDTRKSTKESYINDFIPLLKAYNKYKGD